MRNPTIFRTFILALTVVVSGCEKIGPLMGVTEKQSLPETTTQEELSVAAGEITASEIDEIIEAAEQVRLGITELHEGLRMPYEVRKSLNEMRGLAQGCVKDTTNECTTKLAEITGELGTRMPEFQREAEFERVMDDVYDARRKLESRRKEALQMSIMYPPSETVEAEHPLTPEQPVKAFKVPDAKLTASVQEIQDERIQAARQWISTALAEAERLKAVSEVYAGNIGGGW